jgi:transcriptional regulator with XRE-family HTH domain
MKKINWIQRFMGSAYWLQKMQNELYLHVKNYLDKKQFTQTKFASEIGKSKGYVSQIMKADFDHKFSTLTEIALSVNKTPWIVWIDLDTYAENASHGTSDLDILENYVRQEKALNEAKEILQEKKATIIPFRNVSESISNYNYGNTGS